jgi:aliphatic nitrilase
MSWPNYISVGGGPLRNRVLVDSQAFAQMSKAFVVSACGVIDDHMIEMLHVAPDAEKVIRAPNFCGGSMVVGPNGQVIAGPMGTEEGILYADCPLEAGVYTKLFHDFAGHYNRADIFQLHINRTAPQIYRAYGPHNAEALAQPQPIASVEKYTPESPLLGGPASEPQD